MSITCSVRLWTARRFDSYHEAHLLDFTRAFEQYVMAQQQHTSNTWRRSLHIIEMFGRFPQSVAAPHVPTHLPRYNAVLGRKSTRKERAFLALAQHA